VLGDGAISVSAGQRGGHAYHRPVNAEVFLLARAPAAPNALRSGDRLRVVAPGRAAASTTSDDAAARGGCNIHRV